MVRLIRPAAFEQEVLTSSAPVLVNFWAPWCGVCRLVDPMLSDLQSTWKEQLRTVSINADESLKLVSTYKLTTLPTVMLFSNGNVLYRIDQFRNRQDFQAAAAELQSKLEQVVNCYSYSL
ncbi:thioredoxin [Phormidium tenue FACHB-886]|nr:thioredoxin [Phormidium tenue FACHB-886]